MNEVGDMTGDLSAASASPVKSPSLPAMGHARPAFAPRSARTRLLRRGRGPASIFPVRATIRRHRLRDHAF